ncbi:MAG: hypothetical protein ACRCY4_04080 [Brevinema sp.]
MGIFLIIGAGLSVSPLVFSTSGLLFPFSFLGLTLFYLLVIYEKTSLLVNIVSTLLWLTLMVTLLVSKPLMYHLLVCFFFAVQSLQYGFRSSSWVVQFATLVSFFSFFVGVFTPLGLYIGVFALMVVLLCVRPFGRIVVKETTYE